MLPSRFCWYSHRRDHCCHHGNHTVKRWYSLQAEEWENHGRCNGSGYVCKVGRWPLVHILDCWFHYCCHCWKTANRQKGSGADSDVFSQFTVRCYLLPFKYQRLKNRNDQRGQKTKHWHQNTNSLKSLFKWMQTPLNPSLTQASLESSVISWPGEPAVGPPHCHSYGVVSCRARQNIVNTGQSQHKCSMKTQRERNGEAVERLA